MKHDPTWIKPNADYKLKPKPLILIKPECYEPEPEPQPRSWKVSQYVPIVKRGLAPSGTNAAAMLNMSWLPEDASPDDCLAWTLVFCHAVEGGVRAREAARIADRQLKVGP